MQGMGVHVQPKTTKNSKKYHDSYVVKYLNIGSN